jgi:hypothetical protein
MRKYAARIKPILEDLSREVELRRPVLVERHLRPLFIKHSQFEEIQFVPINKEHIIGAHVASSETKTVIIFYKECKTHRDSEIEGSCPDCQLSRIIQAKELVHVLDDEKEKTCLSDLAESLIDQLLDGAFDDNEQVHADAIALAWAIELLFRFQTRQVYAGSNGASKHSALVSAERMDDYSLFANLMGIPGWLVKSALSDRFMDIMKDIRTSAGILNTGEWS